MVINKKATNHKINKGVQLAGGSGAYSAKQSPEQLLRRATLAALLFEDTAYESGAELTENIEDLVSKCSPEFVRDIAIECREKQKLKRMPIFLAREMCRHESHIKYVAEVIEKTFTRPDMCSDFVALYWSDNDNKKHLPHAVRRGLSKAFLSYSEYSLEKWNKDGKKVKLRDVLRLCHPKTNDKDKSALLKRLLDDELAPIVTWDRVLSEKGNNKESWTELLEGNHVPAEAFLKNLKNMVKAGVSRKMIADGLKKVSSKYLLPMNFFAAATACPSLTREIEDCMLRHFSNLPKLSGHTLLVIDMSGSMNHRISKDSEFTRKQVAYSMATLVESRCEFLTVVGTCGSDDHYSEKIALYRGFALANELHAVDKRTGLNGIFTTKCMKWCAENVKDVDRIIVFSDSQDVDSDSGLPKPFGKTNYIVDVSAHSAGINYQGVWTAEISGWSDNFIDFIYESEKNN